MRREFDFDAAGECFGLGYSSHMRMRISLEEYHDDLVIGEGNGRIPFRDLVIRSLLLHSSKSTTTVVPSTGGWR